jgi:aspartate-semialdehyde dehydrogenase
MSRIDRNQSWIVMRERDDDHVGRLMPDSVLDYRFVVLSHNTIRGAAGAAILNAELLIALGIYETPL